MRSNIQAKTDLAVLSNRLRTVAYALRHLPADVLFLDKIDDLCDEVRAIAAELLGH